MICEICGAEVPYTKNVSIEGTILKVCSNCAKFGIELSQKTYESLTAPPSGIVTQRLQARTKHNIIRDIYNEIPNEELVADYPKRIQKARTLKNWKQEELAQKINEKKSVITKLETGDMRPDDKLVKKLENLLGIKLKEKVDDVAVRKQQSSKLTLGDFITIKKE